MSFTDLLAAWAGDTDEILPCGCAQFIVDTIEETLGCLRAWTYYPGIGWAHALRGPE